MALCGCNHRFVTVTSDKKVMATSETAKEKEMIKVYMLSNNTMYVVTLACHGVFVQYINARSCR